MGSEAVPTVGRAPGRGSRGGRGRGSRKGRPIRAAAKPRVAGEKQGAGAAAGPGGPQNTGIRKGSTPRGGDEKTTGAGWPAVQLPPAPIARAVDQSGVCQANSLAWAGAGTAGVAGAAEACDRAGGGLPRGGGNFSSLAHETGLLTGHLDMIKSQLAALQAAVLSAAGTSSLREPPKTGWNGKLLASPSVCPSVGLAKP